MLGVGTPNINATRSGTSIGIVAGGVLYLFDAGAGVERRLMEAGPKLAALRVGKLGPLFLTHLDPDHTLGLAGLLYYNDATDEEDGEESSEGNRDEDLEAGRAS